MKIMWLIKHGQRRYFDSIGTQQVVTLLKVLPPMVIDRRLPDKDGYSALIIGWGYRPLEKMKKPQRQWLEKKGIKQGFQLIREVKISPDKLDAFQPGQLINWWEYLQIGQLTDVTGISKGRGFTGVVKRWGFAGGPRTHGQSDRERAPGSIGAGTSPGRVVKGKKMPGHYGNTAKTILNLPVVALDKQAGLVLIKGLVPGSIGKPVKLTLKKQIKINPIKTTDLSDSQAQTASKDSSQQEAQNAD
ncbi:MAG: 50S ribosomal protein L3 [bacterium]|nr:50S ribosomal protein L3 [bacterium]